MDTSILACVGLTPAEAKVYVALLELGPSKAGALIQATSLQNSVVHLSLGKLSAKGFISFVRQGHIKFYQACDPRVFERVLDDRQQEMKAIIPEMIRRRNRSVLDEAEVYEGMTGLRTMCYRLIEDSKAGDEFLFFFVGFENKAFEIELLDFYREFTDDRMRRGLVLKGIAPEKRRNDYVGRDWPHQNILYVNLPTLRNLSICNNRVIFTPWKERQVSFMITSSELATNLREYFYSVWDAPVLGSR